MIPWLALGIFATTTGTAALLSAEYFKARDVALFAKPVASTGFIVTALANGAMDTPHGKLVLFALAFSMLGDLFLLSRQQQVFLFGLGAFLIGHLFYAAAFLVRGVHWSMVIAAGVLLSMFSMGVWTALHRYIKDEMKRPVQAYIAVITAMVSLAAGTSWFAPGYLIYFGAMGFMLSDISVALDRFVEPKFTHRAWGIPLYYGAQIVLALSAVK